MITSHAMSERSPLVDEVRGFLDGLKTDWPELFGPRPEPAPRPAPAAPASAGPILIPEPARDAPLRPQAPEGDLVALFRARAERWAAVLGVTFGRVSVKDQRSLWGSCTREGNLSFNWRLALAPDCVLDYLVVHELAHRAHMDHSRRFWEFVEKACPGHRAHRRWLRENGAKLYRAKRDD